MAGIETACRWGIRLIVPSLALSNPMPAHSTFQVANGPAPAQQPVQSTQQAFEAATALTNDDKRLPEALAAWQALETRMANKPKSVAVIRARKSLVLKGLKRFDEASESARSALAGLSSTDPNLKEDRTLCWLVIAQIAQLKLDYSTAAASYRQAADEAPEDALRLRALQGSIATNTFVDPAKAATEMVLANEIVARIKPQKSELAPLLLLTESELLLNQRGYADAKKVAGDAVAAFGGIYTTKIDPRDASARSDYALAALLLNQPESAREYLARAGAGRFTGSTFEPGTEMTVPDCGGDGGLKPEDAAVIEFTIDTDGKVTFSRPVYAAGGGAAGLAFARKAREWSFKPENVASLPGFYRYQARVELRCTTVLQRPSIFSFTTKPLIDFLGSQEPAEAIENASGSSAARLPEARQALAKLEATGAARGRPYVLALLSVGFNPVAPVKERIAALTKALAALDTDTPTLVRLAIDTSLWLAEAEGTEARQLDPARIVAALSTPAYRDNVAARNIIAITAADYLPPRNKAIIRTYLQRVVDDTALARNDPLRVGALIRLASLNLADGKVEEARAAFDQSGLSAQQCAIADAPPKALSAGGTFPEEAFRYGFEGWTAVEFDIDASGSVVTPRVIVAYPPFVFNEGSLKVIKGARYTKTYRPDGGLGCGGSRRQIKFRIP